MIVNSIWWIEIAFELRGVQWKCAIRTPGSNRINRSQSRPKNYLDTNLKTNLKSIPNQLQINFKPTHKSNSQKQLTKATHKSKLSGFQPIYAAWVECLFLCVASQKWTYMSELCAICVNRRALEKITRKTVRQTKVPENRVVPNDDRNKFESNSVTHCTM